MNWWVNEELEYWVDNWNHDWWVNELMVQCMKGLRTAETFWQGMGHWPGAIGMIRCTIRTFLWVKGMNNSILDVLKDVQLFKAQAHIPPGLRKKIPKGGVVLLFPRSSFRCFVVSSFRRSLCRGVVVLSMGCTTSRRRNLPKSMKIRLKLHQNPSQMV